ncbi:MAG: PIG-L family deacetylase [Patescibacteria group bacterium]
MFFAESLVPTIKVPNFEKALFIFPHPDDEILGCGGLIGALSASSCQVALCVLTKGEAGGPLGGKDEVLANIRVKEMQKSAKILGASMLIQEDFGDGELNVKKEALNNYLSTLLTAENPDLVVTYDLSGLYGHEDHIAVSQIITTLIASKSTKTKLWYLSFPPEKLKSIKLPEHMAKDAKFKERRSTPTHKIFVGKHTLNKIRALYAHKSQLYSFRSAFPHKFIPLGFYVLLMGANEYFSEAAPSQL